MEAAAQEEAARLPASEVSFANKQQTLKAKATREFLSSIDAGQVFESIYVITHPVQRYMNACSSAGSAVKATQEAMRLCDDDETGLPLIRVAQLKSAAKVLKFVSGERGRKSSESTDTGCHLLHLSRRI